MWGLLLKGHASLVESLCSLFLGLQQLDAAGVGKRGKVWNKEV